MDIKLEIKINENKKIKLTEDEARELYEKLDEMFGVKEYTIDRYINPNPYFPSQPSVTYDTGDVLCTGGWTTSGFNVDKNGNIILPSNTTINIK